MSKYFFLFLSFLGSHFTNAQTKNDSIPVKHWKINGSNSITGAQTSFDKWQLGGTNNLTVSIKVNYDFIYHKEDWTWDNKFIGTYGFNRNKRNSLKKTDDRIELNSILSKTMNKEWSYSAYVNFKTQLDKGYDPNDENKKISRFMSPVFLELGPGVLWKKNDNFKINISPASTKFIFVHEKFTKDGKSFSVEQNETQRLEFGAAAYVYYRVKVLENISIENILGLYSNYIVNTKNVDFDYQLNIDMKVNKFITANVTYQAIYDDETFGALQQRQNIGVGFKYSFHN